MIKNLLYIGFLVGLLGCAPSERRPALQETDDCTGLCPTDRWYTHGYHRWSKIKSDISSEEFQALGVLKKNRCCGTALVVTRVVNLTDESFKNGAYIKELHLNHMPQLTDKVLAYLPNVTFLKLEDCPHITYKGVGAMKSLKKLYLWNMPHFSDHQVAILREKGIRIVWDGRFKK